VIAVEQAMAMAVAVAVARTVMAIAVSILILVERALRDGRQYSFFVSLFLLFTLVY